jgi:hypothetical protein
VPLGFKPSPGTWKPSPTLWHGLFAFLYHPLSVTGSCPSTPPIQINRWRPPIDYGPLTANPWPVLIAVNLQVITTI